MSAVTPEALALHKHVEACRGEFDRLLGKYFTRVPMLFRLVVRGDVRHDSVRGSHPGMDPADGTLQTGPC